MNALNIDDYFQDAATSSVSVALDRILEGMCKLIVLFE